MSVTEPAAPGDYPTGICEWLNWLFPFPFFSPHLPVLSILFSNRTPLFAATSPLCPFIFPLLLLSFTLTFECFLSCCSPRRRGGRPESQAESSRWGADGWSYLWRAEAGFQVKNTNLQNQFVIILGWLTNVLFMFFMCN